jgi:uncharacterized protein (DUF302 family)
VDSLKYEVVTDKPFEKAVTSIIKRLEEQKFCVWKLDLKERLHEKGVNFENGFIFLEACDPHQAKEILSDHPDAGYFIPCKLAVYEVKGSVVIGMVRPEILIDMLGYEDLKNTIAGIEEKLVRAIDNSV